MPVCVPTKRMGKLSREAKNFATYPSKDARKFSRFFMAGAAPCEMDKQGRTLVPATLREFAQMKKEVVLTGMADRIEIWSKEKWIENNSYEDMDDIAASMQELGLSI